MTISVDRTLIPVEPSPSLPFSAVMLLFGCITAISAPCTGQEPRPSLPKVMMLSVEGITLNEPGVFKAIRAQLSAQPLILMQIDMPSTTADPLLTARVVAEENDASLLFWIKNEGPYRLYFFVPDSNGGHVSSRTLALDFNSPSSRAEVIGIAASSMIEGLLQRGRSERGPPATPRTPIDTTVTADRRAPDRKWIEVASAYAGVYFARNVVTHGARLSLGMLPVEQLVITASYIQSLPMRMTQDAVRLTVVSRFIEVSVSGQILLDPIALRLGVAWSIDLRSFSATSVDDRSVPEPDGVKGVNVIMPFVSAIWIFAERIGVFARVGAGLSIDETDFGIKRADITTDVFVEPFFAKLTYQLGIVLRL